MINNFKRLLNEKVEILKFKVPLNFEGVKKHDEKYIKQFIKAAKKNFETKEEPKGVLVVSIPSEPLLSREDLVKLGFENSHASRMSQAIKKKTGMVLTN